MDVDHPPSLAGLHSPLAIAVLTFVAALGGSYLRDRLSMEGRDGANAARIATLSAQVDTLERTALPAAQFRDFQNSTAQRLDDIRQDLRDLKKLLAKP